MSLRFISIGCAFGVTAREECGFNAPAWLVVGTNRAPRHIHPPRPRISLQWTARDGRCGRISTYDLTRTRYLPPLSPRKKREREISIVHRRGETVLPVPLPSSPPPFLPLVPFSFRRNLIAAVLNETFISIISARRSSPVRSARKRIHALTRRLLRDCSRASATEISPTGFCSRARQTNLDESNKRENTRAMLMISINASAPRCICDI